MKKERKEREKEEKRRSRQRASSESGSESAPVFLDRYGEAAAAKTTRVPSLSLGTEGDGLEIAADSTKSPSTFLLDQMTTMLALMNGHHEHEVARLSLAGLLDILSRIEDNDPRVTSFDGQDYRHCFTTELYERLFLALEKNRCLATLKLTHLDLEDGHLQFLAESLQINTSIVLLDLSWNQFTDEGVLRLLEALEGSLGNRSLQDVYLFGNAEPLHPKVTREIHKYLRRNKTAAKRPGRSATVYVPMPAMMTSPSVAAAAATATSAQHSPAGSSSPASHSPYSSTSAVGLSSSGGIVGGAGVGSGGLGVKDKRSSLPVSEKDRERLRKLEDELGAMAREMKENKREKKALKELNELLKQKITDLVATSSTSSASAVSTPPPSPSTSVAGFPPFGVDSKEARRRSKEIEKEEKAHRKAEKAAQKKTKRNSTTAPQPAGAPAAPSSTGTPKRSPRGVKNFFASLGSSDATVATQKGRERAHSLTFDEPPAPVRPVPPGSPSQTIVNPLSADRSLGASHLYGMASVSALGSLVSARAGGGGIGAKAVAGDSGGAVGAKKKAVIGRCIRQVNIAGVTPAKPNAGQPESEDEEQQTTATKATKTKAKKTKSDKKNEDESEDRGEAEVEQEDVYCSAYECLLDGWGCQMRELTMPIALLSNTIHSISSPPTSPTARSAEARRAAVRLTKRGLNVSINPLDDLEKEIIKLEQLPAHDNVVRYLAHERCGPHFDTLRVYVTRQETSLAHFLRERRKRRDLLSEWEVIQIANQIHAAVHFLHSNAILHRDLRLDNIFLWGEPSDGRVVVGGFDSMDAAAAAAYEIKSSDPSNGSFRAPHFVAPELLSTAPNAPLAYTTQTDVWAFGMILYSLLTLRVPFDGMTSTQVKEAVLAGQRPELKSKDQLEADNVVVTAAPAPPTSPAAPSTSPARDSKSPRRRARSPRKRAKENENEEAEVGVDKAKAEEEALIGAKKEAEAKKRKSERTKALMRYAKLQDLVRNMTAQDPARRPTLDKVKLYLFLCESL